VESPAIDPGQHGLAGTATIGIADVTVTVGSGTLFKFGDADDLAPGIRVEVEGTFSSPIALNARRIQFILPSIRFRAPVASGSRAVSNDEARAPTFPGDIGLGSWSARSATESAGPAQSLIIPEALPLLLRDASGVSRHAIARRAALRFPCWRKDGTMRARLNLSRETPA